MAHGICCPLFVWKEKGRVMKKAPRETRTPFDGLRFFSALTHGVGAWLASVGTAVLVVLAALTGSRWHLATSIVYGVCLIGLYTASTLYHALPLGEKGRRVLRKLDHMMIYFLIAGTYTPICLITLRGVWGWWLFGIIWFLAVAGSLVKLLWMAAPRWLSAGAYIAMGWLVIVAVIPLVKAMETLPFVMLLVGGAFYTLGGIIYALKLFGRERPKFGFHEWFHICVLLGSISHYIMILLL